MTGSEPTQVNWLSTRKIGILLLAIWLATVVFSLFLHRNDIALLKFGDPDDSMRLVQVRDFLAGQSWFDVSQHRANPPLGGPMHWSRLVDLPIAGFVLLLRPLAGPYWAEVGAVLIVPALTLAVLLMAFYWAVNPLMGKSSALLCCALLATTPVVMLIQCATMRIDHHAWQIVMMALVLGGTLHTNLRRGGFVAGLAMAIWLRISAEGLPLAALTASVMALRYDFDGREWSRIKHYIWTLVIASVVLLLVTHGWNASSVSYCDAMSPVYLLPLAVVPAVMTAGRVLLGQKTAAQRVLPIGLAAGIAVAIFLATGKQCFAGPFGQLDPQVHKFWYEAVLEGLPIWMQPRVVAILIIIPSMLGTIGYVLTACREKNCRRRRDWLTLLVLAAGATALSMLVMRTVSVAHLLAIPGNALLIMSLGKYARSLSSIVLRIPATASLVFLVPIVAVSATYAPLSNNEAEIDKNSEHANALISLEITALNWIEPATLFAPIDISPEILLRTRNSIIGTGHHRNAQGMKLIISAFLAPPDQARAIVLSSSATYLLMVPNAGEIDNYRMAAPTGLAAQLLLDKPPVWLIPVSVPDLKMLRLYRIDRTSDPLSIRPDSIGK